MLGQVVYQSTSNHSKWGLTNLGWEGKRVHFQSLSSSSHSPHHPHPTCDTLRKGLFHNLEGFISARLESYGLKYALRSLVRELNVHQLGEWLDSTALQKTGCRVLIPT